MDTLHKLAGAAEQPNTIPNPPPIPLDASDFESQHDSHSRRGSKASVPVPLNRKPSQKSFRSGKKSSDRHRADRPYSSVPPSPLPPSTGGQGHGQEQGRASMESQDAEEGDDDFSWGPSHPCFPHPNPHCAPDSEEAKTTRVIRVRRDWLQAGDLYPQYANLYPEILDPRVTDEDFRFLISNINAMSKAAFDPFTARAWIDSILGVGTGYLWDDLGFTGSKTGMKGLEAFIDRWNKEKERDGKNVRLVQLRRTAFMSLDFVVPDPGIDLVADGTRDEDGDAGIGPAE